MTRHSASARKGRPANRLWKARKRMGFTQGQVAAIIGYASARHIGHWEHGRRLPSLVTALKLDIVYRTPVAYLFLDLYARLKAELRTREERLKAKWEGREPVLLNWDTSGASRDD